MTGVAKNTIVKLLLDLAPAVTRYQDETLRNLIPSWLVGSRDAGSAYEFMSDVASRLRGRVQMTTDGRTTRQPWRFTSCSTISLACIRRSA